MIFFIDSKWVVGNYSLPKYLLHASHNQLIAIWQCNNRWVPPCRRHGLSQNIWLASAVDNSESLESDSQPGSIEVDIVTCKAKGELYLPQVFSETSCGSWMCSKLSDWVWLHSGCLPRSARSRITLAIALWSWLENVADFSRGFCKYACLRKANGQDKYPGEIFRQLWLIFLPTGPAVLSCNCVCHYGTHYISPNKALANKQRRCEANSELRNSPPRTRACPSGRRACPLQNGCSAMWNGRNVLLVIL